MTLSQPPSQYEAPTRAVDIHAALEAVKDTPAFRKNHLQDGMQRLYKQLMENLSPELKKWVSAFQKGLDQFMENLRKHLSSMMPDQPPLKTSQVAEVIQYVAIGLAVVVALIFLVMLFQYLRRRQRMRRARQGAEPAKVVDGELLLSSRQHFREAGEYASRREYDAAVRQLYLSMLCLLDETRLVPFETNRTNREYMKRLMGLSILNTHAASTLRDGFGTIARSFEGSRYGQETVEEEAYQSCVDRYNALTGAIKTDE